MADIRTKNFNPEVDKKIRCTCGHPDCDKRSVNQGTLDKAQLVRDDYGHPMHITSGGRCSNHPNQRKKADPNGGDHPRGDGLDIAVKNIVEFNRLAVLAGRHGFNAIGNGLKYGFIHLGVRKENGTQVSSWDY